MLTEISKKVRRGYFQRKERLSWAPFPSFVLLAEKEGDENPIYEIAVRICRYFGGETVSLKDARKEKLLSLLLSEENTRSHFENLGYFYGQITITDHWFSFLKEEGRVLIYLRESSSEELQDYAYEQINSENFLVFSEKSLNKYPFRILSDVLYFISNHEAPVIVRDLVNEFSLQVNEGDSISCVASCDNLTRNEFQLALRNGDVFVQDHKFYRIN